MNIPVTFLSVIVAVEVEDSLRKRVADAGFRFELLRGASDIPTLNASDVVADGSVGMLVLVRIMNDQ